jgi:hypothetical protein
MNKSIVSFRMDDCIRDAVKSWAASEQRTLSNFMEALLYKEFDRRSGKNVTMDSVDSKIDCVGAKIDHLIALHNQAKYKQKTKRDGDERKLTAYDMEYEDFLCEEYWRRWVDHLHKCDVHLNHYQGQQHYARFREIDEEGFNCEALIDELIKRTAKTIYVPFEWKRDLKR